MGGEKKVYLDNVELEFTCVTYSKGIYLQRIQVKIKISNNNNNNNNIKQKQRTPGMLEAHAFVICHFS